MGIGQIISNFWFRQTFNVVVWWFALGTVWDAVAPGPNAGPVTATAILKIIVFGLLAALVTWKLPPYTAGLSPVWWLRFSLSVSLWLFAFERLRSTLVQAWQTHSVGFVPLGNAMIFIVVVAVVTWFTLPRQSVLE